MPSDIISTLLKNSLHHLSLFNADEIENLRGRIFIKRMRNQEKLYVKCVVRGRDVQLKPEEIVRQLYASQLMDRYGYPKRRLACEYLVSMGASRKKVDIVVLDKHRPDAAYIIVELKQPKFEKGKSQLKSYCHATGAPLGVWTNGKDMASYHRKDPNFFEDIPEIPGAHQSLADILRERFTLKDLILKDKLARERKSMKDIILEMEDEVLANAGVDVFEEVFKLIFTKIYDEFCSRENQVVIDHLVRRKMHSGQNYDAFKTFVAQIPDDDFRILEFRNTGQTDAELKAKIQDLFQRAIAQWPGIFRAEATFDLSDSHLAICVSSLQDVKLFNSNLMVVDEAFEYLVNKSAKGEKGQFFTPRHVIDMCVRMLNPQRGEDMIDTAAGSCGFPVHTIFQLRGRLFTTAETPRADLEDALRVFGIDFDEKTVRVARTLNLIAGDGQTNVLHLNTLDYDRWSDNVQKNPEWIRTYGRGYERLVRLAADRDQCKRFRFDIVMANPPFAGDIKEGRILHRYELAYRNNQARSSVARDILFIERNLDFLRPGGRMAIVLPQGRFNNKNDQYIRDFIVEKARILAVVSLHPNTFKPHTGTKTSVLILQKWNDDPEQGPLCPQRDDYPIFMAVSEKGGKDNAGDYIYIVNADGQYQLDSNGHLVIDHDLHDHAGALPPGVAEAFIEWARGAGISFWACS